MNQKDVVSVNSRREHLRRMFILEDKMEEKTSEIMQSEVDSDSAEG